LIIKIDKIRRDFSMKKNSFTLLEMVVVVAILLFLSASLFVLGNVLFKRYFIMQGKMEMLKIQNAVTAYKSATGNFPPDYRSSSHNEDATGNSIGAWAVPIFMDGQWEGYQEAKDVYDKFTSPSGCPKALVEYKDGSGNSKWGVWVWSWNSDIGGELASTELGPGGYVCQNKITILDTVASIVSTFGTKFPSKIDPATGKPIIINYVKIVEGTTHKAQRCGDTQNFVCAKPPLGSDPNDSKYSCGWHNFNSDSWEGAYNGGEMSKALYDYLCRPMKGRMKEGVPVNPKYQNSKPFIEVSNKLIRPAGRPPLTQCNEEVTEDNPNNYKRYGEGLYNLVDSFEIIDVWGQSYFYVSSCKEYTTPDNNYTIKPYQSYWLSDSALGVSDSFGRDLYPPFYNPGSYDLGSRGPDSKAVNWIPFDYKLASPSGYENVAPTDVRNYFIFGNPDEFSGDYQTNFLVLPSDELKKFDYDNDNLCNWSVNEN
jgi:hypothetical protein